MKTVNIALMILMAGLSFREGMDIATHGANGNNVLFCLLFAAFAVRRFLLWQRGSTAAL